MERERENARYKEIQISLVDSFAYNVFSLFITHLIYLSYPLFYRNGEGKIKYKVHKRFRLGTRFSFLYKANDKFLVD